MFYIDRVDSHLRLPNMSFQQCLLLIQDYKRRGENVEGWTINFLPGETLLDHDLDCDFAELFEMINF